MTSQVSVCACMGPPGDCPCIRRANGLKVEITPVHISDELFALLSDEEQKLTLHGSIQQRGGCGSHYSIIAGRVVWH